MSWIVSASSLLLAFGCLLFVACSDDEHGDAKIAGLFAMVLLVLISAAAAAVQAKV